MNPMSASSTGLSGDTGEIEVMALFQRLNWAGTQNARHDLGTDLFLQVRDHVGVDLGVLAGAQVKSGESYFREEESKKEASRWSFENENAQNAAKDWSFESEACR